MSKQIGMYHILEKLESEIDEYIKNSEVGFYLSDNKAKFISTKRHILNYDCELSYDEISGIAFGNVFVYGDEYFIIFLRGDKRPIYFNTSGYASEELQGYDEFLETLKFKLGFEPVVGNMIQLL